MSTQTVMVMVPISMGSIGERLVASIEITIRGNWAMKHMNWECKNMKW
jgi:hypothetical protein